MKKEQINKRANHLLGGQIKDFNHEVVRYGAHSMTLVTDADMPNAIAQQIKEQIATAEGRGIRPDQDTILVFACEKDSDRNQKGRFTNTNSVLTEDGLHSDIQINLLTINMAHIENELEFHDTIEHEFWHAIDYMGDHSGIRTDQCKRVDFEGIATQQEDSYVEERLNKERISHGAMMRVINIYLEQFKAYAMHGSEWFVHQQMCRTRKVEPGSMEGFMFSHGLHDVVFTNFERLLRTGHPRGTVRKIWNKYFWNSITQERGYWREELADKGWAWLVK